MKKQLLTTTALVAAGVVAASHVAEAKMKMSIRGDQTATIGVADQSSQQDARGERVGFDVKQDSEIHFLGSGRTDNGLRLSARVELEGNQNGDQIDEAFVTVAGSWGQLRIGSEDNAASLMTTGTMGSWATNVAGNLNFDTTDWVVLPTGHSRNATSRLDLGEGDSEKITYMTPRVGGFQAGISYVPSGEEDANSSMAPTTTDMTDGWAFAANYRGGVGGARVGLAAGYMMADGDPKANTLELASDPEGWIISGSVRTGGVTLAAGYLNRISMEDGTGNQSGGTSLDIGAKYDFGKNHVSIGYVHNESEGAKATSKDDQSDRVQVSYRRDLGPGMQYGLNFYYADFEGETAGSGDDNEGIGISTSIRVRF